MFGEPRLDNFSGMKALLCVGVAISIYATVSVSTVNLYPADLIPSPVNLTTSCINAVNASINCDSAILPFAFLDYYGPLENSSIQSSICDSTCGTSLVSYRKNVVSICTSQPEIQQGYPITYVGDLVWNYYNLTCLKDPATGDWCTDYIGSVTASITTDTAITSLNSSVLCSTCMLSLLKNQQSTAFSGYDNTSALSWASIQKECGVSYPTVAQPSVISPTAIPGFANSSYSAPCLSGKTYAVKSGDNCENIAEANTVATGTLITINQLLPTCTDLFIGQSLCLPLTCTTYKVQSGDTCNSIASSRGISLLQLQTWNPTLNQACTNLLSGANMCVGIPGGQTWNGTTIAGATATQTAAYATATVAPPGPTAAGTTNNCGGYYQVQSGDICQLVALNNTISITLLEAINPSINSGCTNLVPGLYYCVFPTAAWNVTGNTSTATTTVAAPAPTTSGTTTSCYEWYTVKSGDYCSLIEASSNITFAQLQTWNPSIDSACDNLQVGDAYCVDGPAI